MTMYYFCVFITVVILLFVRYNTLTHIYSYLAFVANWDAFFLLLCRCLNTDVNTLEQHTSLYYNVFGLFYVNLLMMMILCVLSVISSFWSCTSLQKAEPFIRKLSYVPGYSSYVVVIFTTYWSYIRWLSINPLMYCIWY